LTEATGTLAVLPPQRERLAIVSTRNPLCGIAAYTAALESQLTDLFDVTVFDLNQSLLRSNHPRVRKIADKHIQEICREIATFDAVNLQLEYGTLGRSTKDIRRRFSWLIGASPRLSVAFHTVKRAPRFPTGDYFRAIFTGKLQRAADIRARYRRDRQLCFGIAKRLHRAARQKSLSVIVHNRRDRLDMEYLHGFGRVFDHPLSFLSAETAEAVRRQATRRAFPLLDTISADDVLVGVFGFINDYKGFRTAIRALHDLPKHYHLLIFGGVHPNEIPLDLSIHPHVGALLDDATIDAKLFEQLRNVPVKKGIRVNLDIKCSIADLLAAHSRELSGRIHFMGAVDDPDFLAGMAICDVVVFPYLEVGQSSSGPISQARELGCCIIASRSHTFLDFAAYHPNTIEFFDIGNHLELAERIAARPQYSAIANQSRYNTETNKAIYLAANSAAEPTRHFHHSIASAMSRRRESAAD
jgi:glycosyltransferase involved in cell wall biosynthesis